MTILSMRYVNRKIDMAKPDFVYARRKARQAEGQTGEVGRSGHIPSSSAEVLLTPIARVGQLQLPPPALAAFA